jgi:hypothetical protein
MHGKQDLLFLAKERRPHDIDLSSQKEGKKIKQVVSMSQKKKLWSKNDFQD